MLKNPRLKYCYHAELLEENRVLLLSEKNNAILSGKLYCEVLAHLREDGLAVQDLISQLENNHSSFEIMVALSILEKGGYITESVSFLPHEYSAYWNSIDVHPDSLREILESKFVSVEFLADLPREIFLQTLQYAGIKTGKEGVLRVIVTDDYEREELEQINREAMVTRQPWMLVKPIGVEFWLGPIFIPGKSGCWECLRQRLKNNRPMNTFYRQQKNTEDLPPRPNAALHMTLQIAANQVILEIIKWLYFGKNECLEGKIVTFDTQTFTTQSHALVKRPQCKTCCSPACKQPEPEPIVLKRKLPHCATYAGGYREISHEDTIEKYQHHVSPITGVMPKLQPYYRIKGTPIYNYNSGRSTALKSKTSLWLNLHLRSSNGGKGRTLSQAKAGALCEAIERYSITYHGDEPFMTASLKDLGDRGIHPNACMNYSESQYRDREVINQTHTQFYNLVPVPFDDSIKMHWTPVYSLTEKTFKYLPSCFCYAQYPAEDESNLFSYPDCNGSAAGNSLEEAILQGFLELVERDSVALWWYNRLPMPAVDLHSFNDPYFIRLIDYYKSLNRSLYVLDLTADLQIPAFAAISHRLDNNKQNIVFGFGAHVDAKIGVERALAELNQILPITNVSESDRRRGKYRTPDKTFIDWLDSASMECQPYLKPLENVPVKKACDFPRLCESNIYDSLMFCLKTASRHGLETLALDMTRPDVGLNVVRVFVPGIRHFWKRLAPGRLYDIPVKMGLLKVPLKEEEVNPIGLFV